MGGRTTVTMFLAISPEFFETTYYAATRPGDPHRFRGTLGEHERAHKRLASEWWTVANLRQIVTAQRMSTVFFFLGTRSPDRASIETRVERQTRQILVYLIALHQFIQETRLDKSGDLLMPVFFGETG